VREGGESLFQTILMFNSKFEHVLIWWGAWVDQTLRLSFFHLVSLPPCLSIYCYNNPWRLFIAHFT
jgi:hypothetical protein